MSKIVAICISDKKGVCKKEVSEAYCEYDYGLKGDAHAGSYRQVSLMSLKDIKKFQEGYPDHPYGAYGENILVDDLDLCELDKGDVIKIGEVFLEVIEIGKECHSGCAIAKMTGKCVMPKIGVFTKVIKAGMIHKGDEVKIDKEGTKLERIFDQKETAILESAKITVVGAGGLGMIVCEMLVRSGIKHLTIIDGDVVTYGTFDRQTMADRDTLKRPKTEVVKERLEKIFSDLDIKIHNTYLTRSNQRLIEEGNIVIDCVDNSDTKLLLEEICEKRGSILIHGAVDSYFGQVAIIMPHERILEKIYKGRILPKKKVFTPIVNIIASLVSRELIFYLLDPAKNLHQELLVVDLMNNVFTKLKIE